MLDNLAIKIEECEISFFDEEDKTWLVDCWWVDDSGVNKEYETDSETDRVAVVATISENGEEYHFNHNFGEAITEDNDNSWVIDEIEDRMREIAEDYYHSH